MRNDIPPSGVIGPNHLFCVKARAYSDPENKRIPEIRKYPARFTFGSVETVLNQATIKSAKECINWYKTPV